MIALIYPWIILLLVVVALILAVRKQFVIGGVCFLASLLLNWYCECFSFHFAVSSVTTYGKVIRVMSWNVNGEYYPEEAGNVEGRIAIIRQENADVLYLAEDFWGIYMQMDSMLKNLFPYSTFYRNTQHYIYSKFPIVDCKAIEVEGLDMYSIEKVRVLYNSDTLVVYGCHLSSNNYLPDHVDIRYGDAEYIGSSYLKSIPYASKYRTLEAEAIISDLVKLPTIVMGDLNDVCGSPCMEVFENAGLRDAWWDGGFGYGATIHKPLPYRIDHIMYSNGLRLKGIKRVCSNGLSDHDALVTDFKLR